VLNGVGSNRRGSRGEHREPDRNCSEALAARCQRGDRAACEALLKVYRPLIYTLVRATGRDRDWVEDTVVEVLVQLCRSIGSFRGSSSFKTWLYSVTMRVCAAELRKAGRGKSRLVELDQIQAVADDPVELVSERTQRESALQMVAQLPEKYRLAVVLRHVMGCTYPELAKVLGVPLGTAKTRVFMGIKRIRDMMREGAGGEDA
jgi:RNA polymerase sigma factor (sigma-70 family)